MQRGCSVSEHPYNLHRQRGELFVHPIPISTSLTTDAQRGSYRATPHQLLMSTAVASEMSCLQSYCNDYPKTIFADAELTF